MNELVFHWIGWNREGTSDKVWGFCSTGGSSQCYAFWGRRGQALSFKKTTIWDADHLSEKKQDKGYEPVSVAKLREVWTTFDSDLQSRLCFAILADRV